MAATGRSEPASVRPSQEEAAEAAAATPATTPAAKPPEKVRGLEGWCWWDSRLALGGATGVSTC